MRVTIEDGTERIVVDGGTLTGRPKWGEWDGTSVAAQLVKGVPERRFTLHVAYPALKPDISVAADGYRDFAGPDAVEDAAWSYLLKSPQVGLWHADGTTGSGRCVESFIHRAPDWHLVAADGTGQVVKTGDWCIGIQWEPKTWELVKSGRIRGVSMQGSATRRRPSPEMLARLRKNEAEEGAAA